MAELFFNNTDTGGAISEQQAIKNTISNRKDLIGTFASGQALTTSFVAMPDFVNAKSYNNISFSIRYTKGDSTTLEVLIEWSDEGTNFFRETYSVAGTNKLTMNDSIREFLASAVSGAAEEYELTVGRKRAFFRLSVRNAAGTTASVYIGANGLHVL